MTKSLKEHKDFDAFKVFGSPNRTKAHRLLSIAEEFLRNHKNIIYSLDTNTFFFYQGGVYLPKHRQEIANIILNSKEMQYEDVRSLSPTQIRDLLKYVEINYHAKRDDFNQEGLLNFKNCFFNLNSMQREEHRHSILSTVQIDYDYNPQAGCPLWEKTINYIFRDNPEYRYVLQEYMGYCLMKSCKYEKALFILGNGQDGKGVIQSAIINTLGNQNVSNLSLKYFSSNREISVMVDKMANICSEIPEKIDSYEDNFKRIVSGEPITINQKYVPAYDTNITAKQIFSANRMPRINDNSFGIYRRLIVIDIKDKVEDSIKDINLKEKLLSEKSGILNWVIEGYKRLTARNDFIVPQSVHRTVFDIELSNNPVKGFCHEYLQTSKNPNAYISKDDVYTAYCKYVDECNMHAYSKKRFGAEFYNAFKSFTGKDDRIRIGGKSVRIWRGIEWRTDSFEDQEKIEWEE